MVDVSWCRLPRELQPRDRELLAAVDRVLAEAVRRAGPHLACRPGCTPCCIGPFEISVLDAARLRRGLGELMASRRCAAAQAVREASRQWELLERHFPGDAGRAILGPDEAAREALFSSFSSLPCPLLDEGGRCLLYASRPISCRSYGYPARFGSEVVEPCRLNFTAATPVELEAATVEFDPEDLEGAILSALAAAGHTTGETVICAVLAGTA